MKNYRTQIVAMLVIALATTWGVSTVSFAQQQGSFPVRPDARKIVPVPRNTIQIDLWFDKQCGMSYRQGEKIIINFRTDTDGFITLYDIDTRGDVSVLFPNRHQPDNFVQAGRTYSLPDVSYPYDLVVEGPQGIEYVDAVASVDPYYHWNYKQGEPEWIRQWGLKNRSFGGSSPQGYKSSPEFKNRPSEFGTSGEQSLSRNFTIQRQLRDNIESKLITRPRVVEQPREDDYGTTTCYLYVVNASPYPVQPSQPVVQPPVRPTPQPSYPSYQDYMRQVQQEFELIRGFEARQSGDRLIIRIPDSSLFDFDSYALRYEARRDLDRVVDILLRHQNLSMVVAGHTDSIGDANYNQRLSEYRAQSVANYLISQGTQSYRISSVGYGESMPVASNSTESGRRLNRRVELIVTLNPQYGM